MGIKLYRRMCEQEATSTLKAQKILPPISEMADRRKWFTTTPFVSCWSHNPYFGPSTEILEIEVGEDYFNRVISQGMQLKSGFKETENKYVFVKVYENIENLYNIGVTDIDELNSEVISINRIKGVYEEALQREILGYDLRDVPQNWTPLKEFEYFIQVPYDVAIMMVAFQTVLREAIYVKEMHFSKNVKYLDKVNFGRGVVTLRVIFCQNIKNMSFFGKVDFSIGKNMFHKIVNQILEVSIYDIRNVSFEKSNERFGVKGQLESFEEDKNHKGSPKKKELKTIPGLCFEYYKEITKELFRKDFTLETVQPLLEFICDIEGCILIENQYAYELKGFIEKSISMSNLVINYLSEMGVEFSLKELILLKWELLLNNTGKPYSEYHCDNKYAQYVGYINIFDQIAKSLFPDDFGFDLILINRLYECDDLIGFKRILIMRKKMLETIISHYGCSVDLAIKKLISYIKVAFSCKVSHIAALKTKRFHINYVNCLGFIQKWDNAFLGKHRISIGIKYEDLYFDYREAFHRIVERFYVTKSYSTREVTWSTLEWDEKDLTVIYDRINAKVHRLLDEEQFDYDTIIGNYFRNSDSLSDKFFSDTIGDLMDHGSAHSNKVGIIAYVLGKLDSLNDEDMEILLLAAKYHDIGRTDDYDDTVHGLKSVSIAKEHNLLGDFNDSGYVYFLIESHSLPDDEMVKCMEKYSLEPNRAQKLYALFKDADGLERTRFDGINSTYSALKVKYLRTANARKLVKFAYILNSRCKIDEKDLNPSIKSFVLESLGDKN